MSRCARGLALPMVLWAVAALTAIVLATAANARQGVRQGIALTDKAEAQAVAEAVLYLGLDGLLAPEREPGPPGTWRAGRFEGRSYRLRLQPESGKVDLNEADERWLAAGVEALGASRSEALGLAARIADWRDDDALPRFGGAEDYASLGVEGAPANRPFRTIDEARRVPGLGSYSARLGEVFTVDSGWPTPRADRLAPALSAAALAMPVDEDAEGDAIGESGDLVTVEVDVETPAGVTYRLRAGVRLTPFEDAPYAFESWSFSAVPPGG